LCPDFVLSDVDEATLDFLLPEIVQAILYIMVLNDALELDVLSKDLAKMMMSAPVGLWWSTFEAWLQCNKDSIWRAHHLGSVSI